MNSFIHLFYKSFGFAKELAAGLSIGRNVGKILKYQK